MARGLLPLLLVVVLIIEAQCKNDTEAPTRVAYKKSITRKRIIAKREINCAKDEYNSDGQCCKKCERGYVKNIDCPKNVGEHCVLCKSGEFIDHINDLDKCRRCHSCDSVLGLEVAKKCTPTQNTECTCAKNYFCNSSVPCTHCEQCTRCENGLVERECTSTSDTVCGMKETRMPWWGTLIAVLFVLGILSTLILCYKRKQKGLTSQESPGEALPRTEVSNEIVPLIYTDIDLSSHIPGIVEEMTLPEVKTFVRYHKVPEPVIDQIVRDNCNDTSDQKIKLFQVWYQRHGIKGACGTLTNSLRELKMCAAADKIEEKLKASVSTNQEGGESYNDNIEQSKTCSQEGGKSYHDNAELSKTYSESMEET